MENPARAALGEAVRLTAFWPSPAFAVAFLEALIRLPMLLTDNGIQFAELPGNRDGPTARWRVNRFDQVCREHHDQL